jgi:hypothetical protein
VYWNTSSDFWSEQTGVLKHVEWLLIWTNRCTETRRVTSDLNKQVYSNYAWHIWGNTAYSCRTLCIWILSTEHTKHVIRRTHARCMAAVRSTVRFRGHRGRSFSKPEGWSTVALRGPVDTVANIRGPGLRLAQPGGPTARISVLPLFTWRRKKIQLPKRSNFIKILTMDNVKKNAITDFTNHRQNPLDFI